MKDVIPRNKVARCDVYVKTKYLSCYCQSRRTFIPCLLCLAQVIWI